MENEPVLRINEIFSSIQGESTRSGLPCTFVRVAGCNLRCAYCDTKYAYEGGRVMTVRQILDAVRALGLPLVEVTGGEPLAQPAVHDLTLQLLEEGYQVMLETNGSFGVDGLDPRIMVVMDVKTPGSGESDQMEYGNFQTLKPTDNIKFVVTSEQDYLWSRSLIYQFELHRKARVLVSAAYGEIDYSDLAEWMVRDRLPARLTLQLQKTIWSPTATGV